MSRRKEEILQNKDVMRFVKGTKNKPIRIMATVIVTLFFAASIGQDFAWARVVRSSFTEEETLQLIKSTADNLMDKVNNYICSIQATMQMLTKTDSILLQKRWLGLITDTTKKLMNSVEMKSLVKLVGSEEVPVFFEQEFLIPLQRGLSAEINELASSITSMKKELLSTGTMDIKGKVESIRREIQQITDSLFFLTTIKKWEEIPISKGRVNFEGLRKKAESMRNRVKLYCFLKGTPKLPQDKIGILGELFFGLEKAEEASFVYMFDWFELAKEEIEKLEEAKVAEIEKDLKQYLDLLGPESVAQAIGALDEQDSSNSTSILAGDEVAIVEFKFILESKLKEKGKD